MAGYPFAELEPRWQAYWKAHETFRTPDIQDLDTSKPAYYVLDMFPYPSGAGLHVGHPEGYTATDILARYKRMKGFNVLHPMGWDAFGLPAEQYAIKTGTHPRDTTVRNVETFRGQLERLGFSYDWTREVNTTDPDYYRWTQWIFLRLHARGLAYEADLNVNWCPELGTVLANEEIVDGRSEVGGHAVVRLPMRQWVLRITAYADRLLADLDGLDWPESIKEMQRHWIGRSEGADVDFRVDGHEDDATIRVFTTRPDTLFGATYCVLAPEHPLVDRITTPEQRGAVAAYREAAARKSDLERTDLQKTKTGVPTGATATNPATGEAVPVWIADYVLASYGTGAIMAVPAHDARDHAFALAFGLPIVGVVDGGDVSAEAFTGDGPHVRSSNLDRLGNDGVSLDGLSNADAKRAMIDWLVASGSGAGKVQYRLRDWIFSRQRYWGEPFPLLHTDEGIKPVAESALPVVLPELASFEPTGSPEGPLGTATDWLTTTDPDTGRPARRETNTMPQWAGSCWYYLRYLDPKNPDALVSPEAERYWMPVDLYVGGVEHAVLHLLYARFWHKVLFDEGVVSTPEPFQRLVNQGLILGENGEKMSKSRGNVVNPDDVVHAYGADSLRLYEMFMGPLEQVKPWSTRGVEGVSRFLARAWRLYVGEAREGDPLPEGAPRISERPATRDERIALHRMLDKVTQDVEGMRFNTALSAMMEFVNAATRWDDLPREAADGFALALSPFAPHLAEELWRRTGHADTLAYARWPEADPAYLVSDTVEIAVQVSGKLRGTVTVAADASKDAVLAAARAHENVAKYLDGATVRKEVVVPGRLVNFVV